MILTRDATEDQQDAATATRRLAEIEADPSALVTGDGLAAKLDDLPPGRTYMADAVTIQFTKEKETKNTIRYQEQPDESQPPIIGILYVAKFWARGADRLTVTLTKGDAR